MSSSTAKPGQSPRCSLPHQHHRPAGVVYSSSTRDAIWQLKAQVVEAHRQHIATRQSSPSPYFHPSSEDSITSSSGGGDLDRDFTHQNHSTVAPSSPRRAKGELGVHFHLRQSSRNSSPDRGEIGETTHQQEHQRQQQKKKNPSSSVLASAGIGSKTFVKMVLSDIDTIFTTSIAGAMNKFELVKRRRDTVARNQQQLDEQLNQVLKQRLLRAAVAEATSFCTQQLRLLCLYNNRPPCQDYADTNNCAG